MVSSLVDWLLNIPLYLGEFSSWLVSPLNERYLNISPLGLFTIGGSTILISIIVLHVVRLFI